MVVLPWELRAVEREWIWGKRKKKLLTSGSYKKVYKII
jgi:hypothetical protein